ncbi:MAG: fimbrial protein [Serratia inhibens]|uniref:fimbrial protein n=1 Tax=Serratia inhibens TaxID=2338073 RepID=UPI003C7BB744
MKLNKLMLATMIAFASASVAHAASNQGSGKVTFTGEIIDAPCSVAPESTDQTVPMGQISSRLLAKQGKSESQPFSIELKDCALTTMKNVKVTFTGTPDPDNAKLLALSGSASGAGIVIYDNLHAKDVELGTATDGQGLNDGNNSLKFAAYLQGSSASAAVVPGEFTSVANFTLAYL